MSECKKEIAVIEAGGVSLAQNFRQRGMSPPTILGVRKLDESIRMLADICFILSQFMCLTNGEIDGRIDGQRDAHRKTVAALQRSKK